MAISVSGIGSGLDIEGIVTQLVEVERQPLLKLMSREAEFQARISAVGELTSALSTFKDAAAALGDSSNFNAVTTSSSDEAVATLSATGEAALGNLSVEVLRLAQAHKLASAAKASTDTFGGAAGDELTLTAGSSSLTIDLSTAKTLQEIRDEIAAAGSASGLSATLLDEKGDGSAMRLVLTANETGYEGRVQLAFGGTIADTTFDFATINADADDAPLVDLNELDASFTVDGFSLTRASNEVADALTGVTLKLAGVGNAAVRVERETGQVANTLSGMVDAYNDLTTTMGTLNAGELSSDSINRSLSGSLRSALGQSISGLDGINNLSQLGVRFTREGDLTFDSSVLDEALSADRSAVEAFFTGEGGFHERLDAVLAGYLDTAGILDSRVDGLNARIDRLQDQQARWEDRLLSIEDRLRKQFGALRFPGRAAQFDEPILGAAAR